MLYQYLAQLRTKTDHHKRRFAVLASGAITGLIFVSWLSVILPNDTNRIVSEGKTVRVAAETSEQYSPISTLKRETAQVYQSIKGIFDTQISNINLQAEYDQMKNQVESGQIKITPNNPAN